RRPPERAGGARLPRRRLRRVVLPRPRVHLLEPPVLFVLRARAATVGTLADPRPEPRRHPHERRADARLPVRDRLVRVAAARRGGARAVTAGAIGGSGVRRVRSGFPQLVCLHVEVLGSAVEADALLLENRHERLRELLLVLARLPHLADAQVAVGAEAHVREQSGRRPVSAVFELLADAPVLIARQSAGREPNENRHRAPPGRMSAESTRCRARGRLVTSREIAVLGASVAAVLFRQFIDDDLGCASYLVGDEHAGDAVLVAPAYAVEQYIDEADSRGMRLTRVLETHTHADHVSGHGRLALEIGLPVHVHDAAGVAYP